MVGRVFAFDRTRDGEQFQPGVGVLRFSTRASRGGGVGQSDIRKAHPGQNRPAWPKPPAAPGEISARRAAASTIEHFEAVSAETGAISPSRNAPPPAARRPVALCARSGSLVALPGNTPPPTGRGPPAGRLAARMCSRSMIMASRIDPASRNDATLTELASRSTRACAGSVARHRW